MSDVVTGEFLGKDMLWWTDTLNTFAYWSGAVSTATTTIDYSSNGVNNEMDWILLTPNIVYYCWAPIEFLTGYPFPEQLYIFNNELEFAQLSFATMVSIIVIILASLGIVSSDLDDEAVQNDDWTSMVSYWLSFIGLILNEVTDP